MGEEQSQKPDPSNDEIKADIGSGVKNAQIGKDLSSTVDERSQNTNVYVTLPEYIRAQKSSQDAESFSMEVEREFRRYFNEMNVSLSRMLLLIEALRKETDINTTAINNLRDQAVKTERMFLDYQDEIDEKIAGLQLPPDEQIKKAALARNKMEIRMQIALTVSLWALFMLIAAQQLGLLSTPIGK